MFKSLKLGRFFRLSYFESRRNFGGTFGYSPEGKMCGALGLVRRIIIVLQ